MKIGSIIELVDDNWTQGPNVPWERPVKNKRYTVREIILRLKPCLLLEEIINPKMLLRDPRTGAILYMEQAFLMEKFRELLPPDAMSGEIKEALKDQIVTYN